MLDAIFTPRLLLMLSMLGLISLIVVRVSGKGQKGLREIQKMRKNKNDLTRRISDAYDLTGNDKATKELAQRFVAEGKVVEGAKLFLSIGFERHAVATLENNGFVEEACAVLLKIHRPERAAIIYERNGMYVEAAEHYQISDKLLDAGQCYLKAAKFKSKYYGKAATAFERAGDLNTAIEAWLAGGRMRTAFKKCLERGKLDLLASIVSKPSQAARLYRSLELSALNQLIGGLSPSMVNVNWMVLFSVSAHSTQLVTLCSRRLVSHYEHLNAFWARIPKGLVQEFILQAHENFAPQKDGELLFNVGCALLTRSEFRAAGRLFEWSSNYAPAALAFTAAFDLEKALALLRQGNHNEIAESLQNIMNRRKKSSDPFHSGRLVWPQDTVVEALNLLKHFAASVPSQSLEKNFSKSA